MIIKIYILMLLVFFIHVLRLFNDCFGLHGMVNNIPDTRRYFNRIE